MKSNWSIEAVRSEHLSGKGGFAEMKCYGERGACAEVMDVCE